MIKRKTELDLLHEFKLYLETEFNDEGYIKTCISHCQRITKYEGSLLHHYESDCGKSLLELYTYTTADCEAGLLPLHHVEIKGKKGLLSKYEGTQ